jgi:hypothetical protein
MKKLLLASVMVWSSAALANNHMIKPDCWEENHNGQVFRHCEVNPNAQTVAPQASPPEQEPPLAAPPAPGYRGSAALRLCLSTVAADRLGLSTIHQLRRPPVLGGHRQRGGRRPQRSRGP